MAVFFHLEKFSLVPITKKFTITSNLELCRLASQSRCRTHLNSKIAITPVVTVVSYLGKDKNKYL